MKLENKTNGKYRVMMMTPKHVVLQYMSFDDVEQALHVLKYTNKVLPQDWSLWGEGFENELTGEI